MISKSRNVIQNGNFDVWQRGTTFTSPALNAYLADRWKYVVVTDTGTVTITADTSPPNKASLYDMKIACTAADTTVAAGDVAGVQQSVEGNFFMSVRDKPMTLSFWVKSYQTGTFCICLDASGSDERFVAEYTVNASATWEKKVIQIPPIPAGTWGTGTAIAGRLFFFLVAGSAYHSTVGWVAEVAKSTSNQVNLFSSTDNYWQVSQVQLEAGSSATEFEVKDPSEVLAACQRYLGKWSAEDASYMRVVEGCSVSTTAARFFINSTVEMRAIPTLTVSAATDWSVADADDGIVAGVSTGMSGQAWRNGAVMYLTTAAATQTKYRPVLLISSNTTAARIYMSAEI